MIFMYENFHTAFFSSMKLFVRDDVAVEITYCSDDADPIAGWFRALPFTACCYSSKPKFAG